LAVLKLTGRLYTAADNPPVLALLKEIYHVGGPPVYPTAGEFDWWQCIDNEPGGMGRARLWFEGDRLIGVSYPHSGHVDLMVHPHYTYVTHPMLAWAEKNRLIDTGPETILTTFSFAGDRTRNAVLRERGYRRQNDFYALRRRVVADSLPPAPLPPGYFIRQLRGEADLEQRVASHRSAFPHTRVSLPGYRRALTTASYRPDLDLVVTAPDGVIAAFTTIWYDADNRIATFEPVGVHADHRRKGLARAVMVEGLRRLQALGARQAFLNSHFDNRAANRLYDALGFRELDRLYGWEKRLRDGHTQP